MTSPASGALPPYSAPPIAKLKIPRTKEKHFDKVASPPGAPRHEDNKASGISKKALEKK